MKKKILSLAIALFTITGINAFAQDNAPCPNSSECHSTAPGDNNKMYQPRKFHEFAFEGILLDINQQTRIDSINEAFKAKRADRMCRNKKECLREYSAKVKEVLTPEQYTVFLENITLNAPENMRINAMNGNRSHRDMTPGAAKKFKMKNASQRKMECKNADGKKDCQKADCQKADCKKGDCKKGDCKKGDCKKK